MEILGYIALVLMGITLGLIGAGGSVLTIPIMIYLIKVPVITATFYSMVIVGSSSLIGMVRYRNYILFRKTILFLAASVLGVFIARHFILSTLLHTLGNELVNKGILILLIIFMLVSGYFMTRNPSSNQQNKLLKNEDAELNSNFNSNKPEIKNKKSIFTSRLFLILIGLVLGVLMGILGAGGGFLIIPILVLIMNFTVREAVATSFFITAMNSLVGIFSEKYYFSISDFSNLIKFIIPAYIGMFIGLYLGKFFNGAVLKKTFGYFIWLVCIFILMKEIL